MKTSKKLYVLGKMERIVSNIDLEAQGLTPKVSEVQELLKTIDIPVRPIIRPRDVFQCSTSDIDEMIDSIQAFQSIPVEGFVLGLLNHSNRIHIHQLETLLAHTKDYPVTFHKAIDQSENIVEDVKLLNQYSSIDYILSSGGKPKAMDGANVLIGMQQLFRGSIMAGGSITRQNLNLHKEQLALSAYHGRRIV